MKRLARRVPWRLWVIGGAVAIERLDGRWWFFAGLVGAVTVLGLTVWLVRRIPTRRIEDWQHAERLSAEWLRAAGCRDVRLTGAGADGGIDVLTRDWAVQVKHRSSRTGRPAVQQIIGAARAFDRQPALISTSGFTAPAIEFATEHDVALVEIDEAGRGQRINRPARHIGAARRKRSRHRAG